MIIATPCLQKLSNHRIIIVRHTTADLFYKCPRSSQGPIALGINSPYTLDY